MSSFDNIAAQGNTDEIFPVTIDVITVVAPLSGSGATITFVASGGGLVTSVTSVPAVAGTGYPLSTTIAINITGGGGTGAVISATTDGSGAISAFGAILSPGSGYTPGTTTGGATSVQQSPLLGLPVYDWTEVVQEPTTGLYVQPPGARFGQFSVDGSSPMLELNNQTLPAGTTPATIGWARLRTYFNGDSLYEVVCPQAGGSGLATGFVYNNYSGGVTVNIPTNSTWYGASNNKITLPAAGTYLITVVTDAVLIATDITLLSDSPYLNLYGALSANGTGPGLGSPMFPIVSNYGNYSAYTQSKEAFGGLYTFRYSVTVTGSQVVYFIAQTIVNNGAHGGIGYCNCPDVFLTMDYVQTA